MILGWLGSQTPCPSLIPNPQLVLGQPTRTHGSNPLLLLWTPASISQLVPNSQPSQMPSNKVMLLCSFAQHVWSVLKEHVLAKASQPMRICTSPLSLQIDCVNATTSAGISAGAELIEVLL